MTVKELIHLNYFEVVNEGMHTDCSITQPYCCDLLSSAMSTAPAGGIWFTVIANQNTLAVASLTETACIVLTQNAALDEAALTKAKSEGITVLKTNLSNFDAAILVYEKLRS